MDSGASCAPSRPRLSSWPKRSPYSDSSTRYSRRSTESSKGSRGDVCHSMGSLCGGEAAPGAVEAVRRLAFLPRLRAVSAVQPRFSNLGGGCGGCFFLLSKVTGTYNNPPG